MLRQRALERIQREDREQQQQEEKKKIDTKNSDTVVTPLFVPWSVPSSSEKSFFDKQHRNNNNSDGDNEDQHQQNISNSPNCKRKKSHFFDLPFPVVYRFLSFLEITPMFKSFYPTCRGFAEVLQNLPASWWYQRLFDSMFPVDVRSVVMSDQQVASNIPKRQTKTLLFDDEHEDESELQLTTATGFPATERLQKLLRKRALKTLLELCLQTKDELDISNAQIAQCAHFFQTKLSCCSACHFPTQESFKLRLPSRVYVVDEQLDAAIADFSTKHACLSSFLNRGDSYSELHRASYGGGKASTSRGDVSGMVVPFAWQFLITQRDRGIIDDASRDAYFLERHELDKKRKEVLQKAAEKLFAAQSGLEEEEEKKNDEQDEDDDEAVFFTTTCRVCKKQHQIPLSQFDQVDPLLTIHPPRPLPPLKPLQDDNDDDDDDTDDNNNQNDDEHARANDHDDDDDDDSHQQSPSQPRNRFPLQRNHLQATSSYPPLKVHPNYFDDKVAEMLKVNTVLSARHETEYWALLNSSVMTKMYTYLFHGERRRGMFSILTNPITLKNVSLRSFFSYRSDSFPRFFCQILAFIDDDPNRKIAKGGENDDNKDKKDKAESDSSSSIMDSESEDEEEYQKKIFGMINPPRKKRMHKKAPSKKLLSFPIVRNVMEQVYENSAEDCDDLFFAGFGRVEVERTPRIHFHVLDRMKQHLGLSKDFPPSLLWNVIIYSCGFAIEYLPYVDDMRVMFQVALDNLYEEAASK